MCRYTSVYRMTIKMRLFSCKNSKHVQQHRSRVYANTPCIYTVRWYLQFTWKKIQLQYILGDRTGIPPSFARKDTCLRSVWRRDLWSPIFSFVRIRFSSKRCLIEKYNFDHKIGNFRRPWQQSFFFFFSLLNLFSNTFSPARFIVLECQSIWTI